MKRLYVAAALLILVLIGMTSMRVGQWMGHEAPAKGRLTTAKQAYDTSLLLSLEAFGSFEPEQHFARDLAVVLYFDQLSCETCTTRELQTLKSWHKKYRDRVDFLLVAHGRQEDYLRSLIRVGKVRFPILLEPVRGASGFERNALYIVDKMANKIIASYVPTPDPVEDHEKTQRLEQLLQKQLAMRP